MPTEESMAAEREAELIRTLKQTLDLFRPMADRLEALEARAKDLEQSIETLCGPSRVRAGRVRR